MGRESLTRHLRADNEGNRIRTLVARGKAVTLLAGDPRIQAHFQQWLQVRNRLVRHGPPEWMTPDTSLDRAAAVVERVEIDALASVLQAMGVPWRWCAEVLIKVLFHILRHNAEHPDDVQMLSVTTRWTFGLRAGQAPPHDAQEIVRDVGWWYRAKVKHPTDSIHALADEYATRENRVTDARSVVQTGIKRAEILLSSTIRP